MAWGSREDFRTLEAQGPEGPARAAFARLTAGLADTPSFWTKAPGLAELRRLNALRVQETKPAEGLDLERIRARLEGLGFYNGLTMRIAPRAPDGERYPIVDGGMTDWTSRLMADRKQRLMTSGIGSEFVCKRYVEGGVHPPG